MRLILRALLCVAGLAGCSQTVATGAEGPDNATARPSTSSTDRLVQPTAQESSVLTHPNASPPPSGPSSSTSPELPAGDARTTSVETHDDGDPNLRQRIRQAAMADGLF